MTRSPKNAVAPVLALLTASCTAPAPDLVSADAERAAAPFLSHLDRLAPAALEATGVPGTAVAVLARGEIAAIRTYGLADRAAGTPVEPSTVFNVGSISKLVTAWAALRLVDDGRLELDRPVSAYLETWPLASAPFDPDGITLRRLLSHTAGLSVAAVPEYDGVDAVPSLEDALREVAQVAEPGDAYAYSGGGYMLVQHLIEAVTDVPFERYVDTSVFEPLRMRSSSFSWPPYPSRVAATPYDDGVPTGYRRYAGQAAASLNTSVEDLARFARASLGPAGRSASASRGETAGGAEVDGEHAARAASGVLAPDLLDLMQRPALATEQQWGVRTGLGYQIWGLHDYWAVDDRHPRLVGHAGQNTGWAATLWVAPSSGDGLVVLTNASRGRELWRLVLCDWARWINGTTYAGMCTDRPEGLPAAPPRRNGDPRGRP